MFKEFNCLSPPCLQAEQVVNTYRQGLREQAHGRESIYELCYKVRQQGWNPSRVGENPYLAAECLPP